MQSPAVVRQVPRCDVLVAAIAAAWFSIRLGRSYAYDESVTVASFVEVDSVTTALTTQSNFNNHPGMTLLAHLMHRLGIGGPTVYRSVAVVAAVVCVVALFRASRRWYSQSAGLVVAAALVVHPMFGDFATQVRGYAPMVCLVTLASIEFVDFVRGSSTSLRFHYHAFAAIAVLFHLYAILPLACHGLVVLVVRRTGWPVVASRIVATVVLGLAGYLGIANVMVQSSSQRSSLLSPSLPLDVSWMLVGEGVVAAVTIGTAALVGVTQWLRESRAAGVAAAGCLVSFLAIWVVLMPRDAYPRMWLWLVPAVALAIGTAWEQSKLVRPLIGLGLVVVAVTTLGQAMEGDRMSETIGEAFAKAEAAGVETCAVYYSSEPILAYAAPRVVFGLDDGADCDVVIAHPNLRPGFRELDLPNVVIVADGSFDRYLIGWTNDAEGAARELMSVVEPPQALRR